MLSRLAVFVPGASRLLANITPILLLFLYTKTDSIEDVGIVNYLISLITILGVVTDFGIPEAAQRFLPQTKDHKQLVGPIILLEFSVILVGIICFLVIDLVLLGELSKGYTGILALILLFSASNVLIIIFNGLGSYKRVTSYYLGTAVLFIFISTTLTLLTDMDAMHSFLIGRLVSWIVFTIIPLLDMYKMGLLQFRFPISRRFITFSINSFFAAFVFILFTQWDSILVTQLGGAEENGIYKSIVFLASVPIGLRVILETKLLPEYSKLFSQGKIEELLGTLQNLTIKLVVLTVLCTLIAIPLSEPVISIIYNDLIGSESGIIFPLCVFGSFIFVATMPSITVLQAIGKEATIRNGSILASVTFFITSFLFYEIFGINGLALLMFLSNILFSIYIWQGIIRFKVSL
jgi:O-antigen/teichoic acid export membrane protein